MTVHLRHHLAIAATIIAAPLVPFDVAFGAVDPMSEAESAVLQTDGEAASLDQAQSAIFQTNGPLANELLQDISERSSSSREKLLARCSIARLKGGVSVPMPPSSGIAIADELMSAYRLYWGKALQPELREDAEKELFSSITSILNTPNLQDRQEIQDALSDHLQRLGIYVATGENAGIYELILYLSSEDKDFRVDLLDGTQHDVKVFFMHEIVSHGWVRYLTCGEAGTGGFSAPNGLYILADQYDELSENFLINFLSHETRHYADDLRYPGLSGGELEYRAKLTQLAQVNLTREKVLSLFISDQSDDAAIPHSWANKRVVASLRHRLKVRDDRGILGVDPVMLRKASLELLLEDNARRDALSQK
jgi:hypothetical protein